jgi:hypothetical protein
MRLALAAVLLVAAPAWADEPTTAEATSVYQTLIGRVSPEAVEAARQKAQALLATRYREHGWPDGSKAYDASYRDVKRIDVHEPRLGYEDVFHVFHLSSGQLAHVESFVRLLSGDLHFRPRMSNFSFFKGDTRYRFRLPRGHTVPIPRRGR